MTLHIVTVIWSVRKSIRISVPSQIPVLWNWLARAGFVRPSDAAAKVAQRNDGSKFAVAA